MKRFFLCKFFKRLDIFAIYLRLDFGIRFKGF